MQYHASMALGLQLVHASGGLKIVAQQPGGAKGNLLKSCGPSKTWYADSWGCAQEVWIIFNVSCACIISLHHRTEGNF